jgi:aminoglycoside phosphotransferase (APT) family kinase protein
MSLLDEANSVPLARWLTTALAAEAGAPVADMRLSRFERPSAGQSSDNVLFSASWTEGSAPKSRDLVLRRQPSAGVFLTPDVVRECRVLQGLEGASRVPVPHVLGFETDPDLLGAPFFVMDRVRGRVPAAKPSIHSVGWLPTLTTAERELMWQSAIEVLVAIHDVDWRTTHQFLLDADESSTGLQAHIGRFVEWYAWTTDGRSFPITDAAMESIASERASVDGGDPVLVWGDARPGNMIFDADNRCAAAIDWEVATIGPAGIDLGHWLFFDAFATTACGVERLAGWPDRDTTVARYEALSRRTVADLEFFELLEALFIATTLIRQADMRVSRGLASAGTRMGHDNAVTQMIARRLGLPVPELSPDYLAHRSAH